MSTRRPLVLGYGTVGFRNVDENVNRTFPGILATELTVSDPG